MQLVGLPVLESVRLTMGSHADHEGHGDMLENSCEVTFTHVTCVDWLKAVDVLAFRAIVKFPVDGGKNVAFWLVLNGTCAPAPDT